MTKRSISRTGPLLSTLALVAGMGPVAAQASAYQVAPRMNPAISRQALVAVRPTRNVAMDNTAIDARLEEFAAANAGNSSVQPALEQAAAAITRNPERFINADGSTNMEAMTSLLRNQFAGVGQLTMPKVDMDYAAGTAGLSSPALLSDMGDGDIMALAFIVMMEAAKSAREDLKNIMDSVKASNEKKQALRESAKQLDDLSASCVTYPEKCRADRIAPDVLVVRPQGQVSKMDIDNARETVKNRLDSMSEMGEMESLRLQMAMDRMSKMMSTLSNLLKKISDTSSGIIQNIK